MPTPVRIVHEDGRFGTVPAENLAEAQKLGWRVEQQDDQHERQKGTVLEAGAQGAAVGAVGSVLAAPKLVTALGSAALGTEDPLANVSGRSALEASGLTSREEIEANAAKHGVAFGAGELAGAVAGSIPLGMGAAGLAGRATGALGLTGRAATLARGIGAGVLEGAALGADQASEQAWIRNEKVTAEQSLAAIGLGALFGGGTTAAISGFGAAKQGIGKLFQKAETETLESAGANLLQKETGSVLARAEQKAPAALEQVPQSLGGRMRRWAGDIGDESLVDALSRGNKRALKDLGRGEAPTALQKRETGKLLHELGIAKAGRSEAKMLEVVSEQRQRIGNRLGSIVAEADKHGGVDATKLFQRIDDMKGKLGGRLAEDRELPQWIESQTQWLKQKNLEGLQNGTGGLMPSDVQSFRMEVDSRLAKWTRAEAGPKGDAARELRRTLEDHLETEIGQKGSPDLLAEYQRAKKLYGAASWATDTLAERVDVRNGANRIFSPSDYAVAATALVSGGATLPALAAGLGNKLLRERGMSTFAALAKKVAGEAVDVGMAPARAAGLAENLQALVASSEHRVSGGVGRFLGHSTEKVGEEYVRHHGLVDALRSGDMDAAKAAYAQHAEDVRMLAAVPAVAQARMHALTGENLATVAPGLHAAMTNAAGRAAQYLQQHLPSPASDPDSLTPQLRTDPPISASDMSAYASRLEGVHNPHSILEDLESGRVAAEKVEAIKAVWPEVYESIRRNIFSGLAEAKEHVPYQKRVLLDSVLEGGGALEPSLRPEVRQAMDIAAAEAMQARRASPSAQNPLAASMRSRTEAIASR